MPATLVVIFKEKKNNHLTIFLPKSVGLIKEFIIKNLHLLFHNKTIVKISIVLRDWFHHISLMSISYIFVDNSNIRLLNTKMTLIIQMDIRLLFKSLLAL